MQFTSRFDEDVYQVIKDGPIYGVTHQEIHNQLEAKYALKASPRYKASSKVREAVKRLEKIGVITYRKSQFTRHNGQHRYTLPENIERTKNPHLIFTPNL